MKRLMLVALILCSGCAAAAGPEEVGRRHQALGAAAGEETEEGGHGLPPVRPGQFPAGKGTPNSPGGTPSSGIWTTVGTTPSTLAAGFSLLLTDGSVMVQDLANRSGNGWWKLSPDASGSYTSGTWKQLASMPGDYAPLYFASAVLPDGRVIVMGGEYQAFEPVWTAQGAIYDPVLDQWTPVAAPPGWTKIGDAQSVVLADGRFVLANPFTTEMAVLDPATLQWTAIGGGKADMFDEEGWTLLWNGSVLTVDANNTQNPTNSELFFPGSARKPAKWSSAGSTIVPLADIDADGGGSHELGAAMLRPDGTVFVAGATGHTAIYDSQRGTWKAGPDFPVIDGEGQLDQADGPAALLPNGNVLLAVSPGLFSAPVHFVEFDGTAIREVARPASAAYDSSYNVNLLLLPTGEVLETDFSGDIEIYSPTGKPRARWAPSIDNECSLHKLEPGSSHSIEGNRLHGLSSGVSYGDDAQASTNYPLVRITHRATGHVAFARTHAFSNFAIGPNTHSEATFDVPADIELGDSDLVVIANGIASSPIRTQIGH